MASEAAPLLELIANEKRLLILWNLLAHPVLTVGAPADAVGFEPIRIVSAPDAVA